MTSYAKILLCFTVAFCVFQAIAARPQFDGNFVENVRFDLLRKLMDVERDFEKDIMNIRYKIEKESIKLMKKAIKEGGVECIESAKIQAEEQLEENNQEMEDCTRDLKDSLESGLAPEATLRDVMIFRNDFKNKLNVCKKSGKMAIKGTQNNFSVTGKGCLV